MLFKYLFFALKKRLFSLTMYPRSDLFCSAIPESKWVLILPLPFYPSAPGGADFYLLACGSEAARAGQSTSYPALNCSYFQSPFHSECNSSPFSFLKDCPGRWLSHHLWRRFTKHSVAVLRDVVQWAILVVGGWLG